MTLGEASLRCCPASRGWQVPRDLWPIKAARLGSGNSWPQRPQVSRSPAVAVLLASGGRSAGPSEHIGSSIIDRHMGVSMKYVGYRLSMLGTRKELSSLLWVRIFWNKIIYVEERLSRIGKVIKVGRRLSRLKEGYQHWRKITYHRLSLSRMRKGYGAWGK